MGILKQKREKTGLSIQELADRVGVKKSTVASYEKELPLNKQFVAYLLTLSQALDLSPKAFKELCERLVK
jgi:transcriptional regulator with XRE-family HTH domain